MPDTVTSLRTTGQDTFARVRNDFEIIAQARFNQPPEPTGPSLSIEGTGGPEAWGIWSTGRRVVIRIGSH